MFVKKTELVKMSPPYTFVEGEKYTMKLSSNQGEEELVLEAVHLDALDKVGIFSDGMVSSNYINNRAYAVSGGGVTINMGWSYVANGSVEGIYANVIVPSIPCEAVYCDENSLDREIMGIKNMFANLDYVKNYYSWDEFKSDLKAGRNSETVMLSNYAHGTDDNVPLHPWTYPCVLYFNRQGNTSFSYLMIGADGSTYEIGYSHTKRNFSIVNERSNIPSTETASIGQIIRVKRIMDGVIVETDTVDIPNRLDVTVSMGDNGFVVSHKFAEIKAAYDAGRAVQLIDTDTSRRYSLIGFFSGSIEGVTYADFRFIDDAGNIWKATITSNDEIEFFQGSTFLTLYGDVPQDTPKAITYSVVNGIGYADFIPYIEIPSTGDELKECLVISPAYFYVMPNAYAPFVLKNLVNPYTLTRLSYSEPKFGTEDNTYEASYLVTDSLGQQIKATCQVLLTESGLGDLVWNFEVRDSLIVKSSTEGSAKKFKITVDDSGTISATEITN